MRVTGRTCGTLYFGASSERVNREVVVNFNPMNPLSAVKETVNLLSVPERNKIILP